MSDVPVNKASGQLSKIDSEVAVKVVKYAVDAGKKTGEFISDVIDAVVDGLYSIKK